MNSGVDLIFYSKNNLALGEKLREILRAINRDLVYSNSLIKLIDRIQVEKQVIVFIDKRYKQYIKMISEIISSSLDVLEFVRLVFIDDDLAYYADYIDNQKLFCIPSTNLRTAIQKIIYSCEMLNYRKETLNAALSNSNETISKYLTSIGFSYKLTGFRYIKQAIDYAIKNNYFLGSLQKDVYPFISLQNNTNPFNIERGIRMAIKGAAKTDAFRKELNISSEKEISNRSFLEFLLDKFAMENYA